jgi:hypothetical protein
VIAGHRQHFHGGELGRLLVEDLTSGRGPQQAQLERQHRPGDGPHREQHRGHLRPALGEYQRVAVSAADAPVVGEHHEEREGHPERHQDDVEAQREGHLLPGRQ